MPRASTQRECERLLRAATTHNTYGDESLYSPCHATYTTPVPTHDHAASCILSPRRPDDKTPGDLARPGSQWSSRSQCSIDRSAMALLVHVYARICLEMLPDDDIAAPRLPRAHRRHKLHGIPPPRRQPRGGPYRGQLDLLHGAAHVVDKTHKRVVGGARAHGMPLLERLRVHPRRRLLERLLLQHVEHRPGHPPSQLAFARIVHPASLPPIWLNVPVADRILTECGRANRVSRAITISMVRNDS